MAMRSGKLQGRVSLGNQTIQLEQGRVTYRPGLWAVPQAFKLQFSHL